MKLARFLTPLALAGAGLLVAGVYFFFFTRIDSYGRVIGLVVAAAGVVAIAIKFALLMLPKQRIGLIWICELALVGALWIYAHENGLP